jgi:hypothetical protein
VAGRSLHADGSAGSGHRPDVPGGHRPDSPRRSRPRRAGSVRRSEAARTSHRSGSATSA